jgi:hypothetical protein
VKVDPLIMACIFGATWHAWFIYAAWHGKVTQQDCFSELGFSNKQVAGHMHCQALFSAATGTNASHEFWRCRHCSQSVLQTDGGGGCLAFLTMHPNCASYCICCCATQRTSCLRGLLQMLHLLYAIIAMSNSTIGPVAQRMVNLFATFVG